MLENVSEFKQDFTPLIKYFDIIFIYKTVNTPQSNTLVYRLYQSMYNMLVTNYLDIKVFDYIDLWGKTLLYIAWDIRASYHYTIKDASVQLSTPSLPSTTHLRIYYN